MSTPNDEITRQAEIDKLLSAANAHRIKGDILAGEDACRHVLEIDPEDIRAREMLADFLHARGKLDDALAEYRDLLQMDSSLAAVERKYAKVALEIGERDRLRHSVEDMLANPEKKAEAKRHAGIAIILSFVAPGVGQIYNGELVKGGIILGAYLLSLLVIAISPGTGAFIRQSLYIIMVGSPDPNNPMAAVVYPSPWLLLFVGVGLFAFIYSVVDAPVFAVKKSREEQSSQGQT